jgi:homogentisate 1,2-dioxygenase
MAARTWRNSLWQVVSAPRPLRPSTGARLTRALPVYGVYDAKAEGFLPGGASLHNRMSAHGPDAETCEWASTAVLEPRKIEDTMAFMFESRLAMSLSEYALQAAELQPDYYEAWQHVKRRFPRQIA